MSDIVPPTKTCKVCLQTKPLAEMAIRTGLVCRACFREYSRKYAGENRQRNRAAKQQPTSLWDWNATKRCRICKQEKPLDQMKKDVNRPDGYAFLCKTCHNLLQSGKKIKGYTPRPQSQDQDIPRRSRASRLHSHLLVAYKLTLEQYNAILASQSGLCAACGKIEEARDSQGNAKRLSVDHDHKTGKVRGLLCSNCNLALGLLREDPGRIQGLLQYLQKHLEDSSGAA